MAVTFDEGALVTKLQNLPQEHRVAFAAMCAERQMGAYRLFEAMNGREVPNALEGALEEVWIDPAVMRDEKTFEQRIEELMHLIPQDKTLQKPWTQSATNAQNAGMSAIYALRTRLSGDAQEAAWAARVAYEALDNFVINSGNIDTNTPGNEQQVLSHPLVQAELRRQQRDLDELRTGKEHHARLIARLRDRARTEAAIFFGAR